MLWSLGRIHPNMEPLVSLIEGVCVPIWISYVLIALRLPNPITYITNSGLLFDDVITQLRSLIEEVGTFFTHTTLTFLCADWSYRRTKLLEPTGLQDASAGAGAKFGGLPLWHQEAESCVVSKDDLNCIYVEAFKEPVCWLCNSSKLIYPFLLTLIVIYLFLLMHWSHMQSKL